MNLKRFKNILIYFLTLLLITSSFITTSMAEQLPIDDKDKLYLSNYIEPVAGENYLYKVSLFVDTLGEELHPPSLITFLLDGTSSMDRVDGTSDARDYKTRSAVAGALRIMMSDENENKETTYINIAMFGSQAGGSVSLTRWASNPNAKFSTNATYNDPNALQAANHMPGQASDYVSLLDPNSKKEKLNPILAQLFYMDYDTLALKPEAPFGSLDAKYPISNMYFFGNQQGNKYNGIGWVNSYFYSQRFPISSTGTYVNGGMSLVYDAMNKKMDEIATSGGFKLEEIEKSKRYVMLLCDGNDFYPLGTESFAAAIKAPTNVTIPAFQYTGGGIAPGGTSSSLWVPITVSAPRMLKGLNSEIWSVLIGKDDFNTFEDTWETSYLNEDFTPTVPVTPSLNTGRNMISIAAAPITNWGPFSAMNSVSLATPVPVTSWNNYYPTYVTNLNHNEFANNTHYLRTSNAKEAEDFFKDFATNALITGGSTGTIANVSISEDFNIYSTDKKYAPYTFSSVPSHIPTISVVNNKLKWNIGTLIIQERVTLVYYLQLKPQYWGDELWHDPSSQLDINYSGLEGGSFQVNFPIGYVFSPKKEDNTSNTFTMNPVNNVNNPLSISADASFIQDIASSKTSTTYSSSDTITASLQPYTASIPNTATKKKQKTDPQITCQVEAIDALATKKEKNKLIAMNQSKVSVYEDSCPDSKIVLYLTKEKKFKISGVTENYYMIQYKKKDGKIHKGYVLKTDVKIISKK